MCGLIRAPILTSVVSFCLSLLLFGFAVTPVNARQPILESRNQVALGTEAKEIYLSAQPIVDPTLATLGIFGKIDKSDEIDLYVFRPLKDDTIPFEVRIPSRSSLKNFRPTLFIIGKNLPPSSGGDYPVSVPLPLDVYDIPSPTTPRTPYFDMEGLGMYYKGILQNIPLTANTVYYLALVDPYGRTGPYAIYLGRETPGATNVELTAPVIDPETIILDTSEARNSRTLEGPSTFEKQFFGDRTSPFQNWDSKFRLWADRIRFILYQITHLL